MNYEYEIYKLKEQVNNLYDNFIQSQRNQVPITDKVDSTKNGLATTDVVVGKNSADIDYVAMMTDVELPS